MEHDILLLALVWYTHLCFCFVLFGCLFAWPSDNFSFCVRESTVASVVQFTSSQASECARDGRGDEDVFWQVLGLLAKHKEVSRVVFIFVLSDWFIFWHPMLQGTICFRFCAV